MKLLQNLILIGIIFFMGACDDDDTPEVVAPLEAKTASDIPANPGGSRNDPPDYTLFSFETGNIVPDSDSATNRWDIGFNSTTIIINGGISGPGSTEAQVLTGLFDEITTAPESGYATDTEEGNAIPTGNGSGWYNYNLNGKNVVTPIPGRVIVVKTSDENYVKFEILNYYQGSPDVTSEEFLNDRPPSRHYTFKYIYQPNGTRDF